jgi:hypothetical protein
MHISSRQDGMTVVVVTDQEYPTRVAFSLIGKVSPLIFRVVALCVFLTLPAGC